MYDFSSGVEFKGEKKRRNPVQVSTDVQVPRKSSFIDIMDTESLCILTFLSRPHHTPGLIFSFSVCSHVGGPIWGRIEMGKRRF